MNIFNPVNIINIHKIHKIKCARPILLAFTEPVILIKIYFVDPIRFTKQAFIFLWPTLN